MPEEPTVSELLRQISHQQRVARNIPSTALELRAQAVGDSVAHIRGDRRFDLTQVVLHNHEALQIALAEIPSWPGLIAEFGVYSGRSIAMIAKRFPKQTIHGFDSFQGLPERWTGSSEGVGAFDVGGKPPDIDAENVEFHVGWFDQTVPAFASATSQPFRFAHLDADLYSSTKTVFDALGDRFVDGTVVVFDEYFGYHAWRQHEHKAFTELLATKGLTFEAIVVGHMSLAVRLLAKSALM